MSPTADRSTLALLHEGRRIETSQDAARFFGVSHGLLLYTLYRAPERQRYRPFEIPKRTGGMRQILAPTGTVRELQTLLAPHLAALYEAHPNAHGFIRERSILSNAKLHEGARFVFNVDLEDFFPSINFGRVRGLFLAPPFQLGPAAASVFAQLCTHRNGLPQGAPTSPVLSNFIASDLDRRLTRLAKENGAVYSRYADDITFSSDRAQMPAGLAVFAQGEGATLSVAAAEPLERAIVSSGFQINAKKVRLQSRSVRQTVTGLNVNAKANVQRRRIRRIRAMLHAWEKFGLESAAQHHFLKHRGLLTLPHDPGRAYRNVVYGQLAFVKMIRGADDPIFLNFAAKLLDLDPKPSKFVRAMVFGGDDFDVFISHASEDKETIARPIFHACAKLGLKVFLDEAHIGWGQNATQKINLALGSARTILAVVSSNAVSKEWPIAEFNTALTLEVTGRQRVVPLMVGRPDLSKLPMIKSKDAMSWDGDPMAVARRLQEAVRGGEAPRRPGPGSKAAPAPKGRLGLRRMPLPPTSLPPIDDRTPPVSPAPSVSPAVKPKRGFWARLFGGR